MDSMSSSPLKTSPKKRRSPTKENQSPAEAISTPMTMDSMKSSFTSPTKKPAAKDMSEERRQRRRAFEDDDVDEKYLSENIADGSPNKSGRKKLPKSPVKRMRQLEKQAEQ